MRKSILDTNAPVVDVPIALLQKMARNIEKVHERMLKTTQALKGAGVRFAVIGGNAVAIWVESIDEGAGRTTKDVDIALERSDFLRAKSAMEGAGFELAEVKGVTVFLEKSDPLPSRAVHVLFVGEKIRPHNVHPVPPIQNVLESPEGVPAIGLAELLILKLQSFRDRDRTHIRDLIDVGLITDAVIAQVPPDLRERLQMILSTPEDNL